MSGITTQYRVVTDPYAQSSTSCRNTGLIFKTYYCTTTGAFESVLGSEYGSWNHTTPEHRDSNEATARNKARAGFTNALNASSTLYHAETDNTYWGAITQVPVTFNLSSALTFSAKVDVALEQSASDDNRGLAVRATGIPTGGWAGLGNNNVYTGIAGSPALFQPSPYDSGRNTTSVISLSDIVLKKTTGAQITSGFSVVAADAEVTTHAESIAWSSVGGGGFRWLPNDPEAWSLATTDQERKEAAVGSNGCGATPASEFSASSDTTPAATRACTGEGTGPRDGSAMVQISPAGAAPFSVTQHVRGGGTQAVAFGIMTTGAQVSVSVADRAVDGNGQAEALDFAASIVPRSGDFSAADTVTANTGTTGDTSDPAHIRVPAADKGFQFEFASASAASPAHDSYTPNWVCSKTTATSRDPIPWSGNGTLTQPQSSPPPPSWSTLGAGEFAECTVTYVPPYLTLVKEVDNAAGGSATQTDWELLGTSARSAIAGPSGSSAVTRVPVHVGQFSITEQGAPEHYRWQDFSCDSEEGWSAETDDSSGIQNATLNVSRMTDTTCTLTNAHIGTRLTLIKEVVNTHGGTATPEEWTLRATGPTGEISGITGSTEVTDVIVAPGTYALSESDGPTGYSGSWACIDATETVEVSATSTVDLFEGSHVTCTATNHDSAGSVTWSKVDVSSSYLAGSAWKLHGPGLPTSGIDITDCTEEPCSGPSSELGDTDERAGVFTLQGLSWGNYRLIEHTPPPGFRLDQTEYAFTVGGTAPASLSVDLGAIVNELVIAPQIPLTGGTGAFGFMLAGLVLLGATLLAVIHQQTRRRATTAFSTPSPDHVSEAPGGAQIERKQ